MVKIDHFDHNHDQNFKITEVKWSKLVILTMTKISKLSRSKLVILTIDHGKIPGCHGHGQCLHTPPPPQVIVGNTAAEEPLLQFLLLTSYTTVSDMGLIYNLTTYKAARFKESKFSKFEAFK